MWVARDQDGTLTLFEHKPVRVDGKWFTKDSHRYYYLNSDLFPNLDWEDDAEEVSLVMKDPIYKTICKCGHTFKYKSKDIIHEVADEPWSGYCETYEYVKCPKCGKAVVI